MDPVSVFISLFDSKCIQLAKTTGQPIIDLSNLTKAPSKLCDALITQCAAKFSQEKFRSTADQLFVVGSSLSLAPIVSAFAKAIDLPELGSETSSAGKMFDKRGAILLVDSISSEQIEISQIAMKLKREHKINVELVFAIVDISDELPLSSTWQGLRLASLYKMSAILRVLEIFRRISAEQFEKARQWMDTKMIQQKSLLIARQSPLSFANAPPSTTLDAKRATASTLTPLVAH